MRCANDLGTVKTLKKLERRKNLNAAEKLFPPVLNPTNLADSDLTEPLFCRFVLHPISTAVKSDRKLAKAKIALRMPLEIYN